MKMTFIRKRYAAYLLVATFLCCCTSVFAQNKISGKVVDNTNFPLPGVTVVVTNTVSGTVTDINGGFELEVPDDASSITISFVGFKSQTIPLAGRSSFNVTLEEDVEQLEEVVITGYGQTQNKYEVTTAISSISAKDLVQDRPVQGVAQALQGTSPAVVVLQQSGSPGADQTIRIRGAGTAGNANPLTLLNGFQVPDMNFFNPNDIQDVQIYKDAAAGAIYGSRAGNGVINIQTKSGNTDKWINGGFSSYYGVQSLASAGDYMTGHEYAQYYNDSYTWLARHGSTSGARAPFTEDEISRLPNTTWIEEITEDATIQDHHLSLYGGKNGFKYYLGGGIFDQEGIIGTTDFSRKTLNLKIESQLTDKLNIQATGLYGRNQRHYIAENSENSRLMSSVASLPGIYPVYAESGSPFNNAVQGAVAVNGVDLFSISEFGNPILGLTHTTTRDIAKTLFSSVLLNYKLFDGLSLNTSYGYMSRKTEGKSFSETFDYPDQQFVNPINSLGVGSFDEEYWQWEGYFGYKRTINNIHKIDLVAGTSILSNESYSETESTTNLSVNSFDEATMELTTEDSDDSPLVIYERRTTTRSYYGRVNYNLSEKYLFGATVRYDGSSKLAQENRWNLFPSFSAGWLISEESFLKNNDKINQLKLRASWGKNGIDNIDDYRFAIRYFETPTGGIQPQDYNPDIKWEEVTQTDIALDVDLFGNRIGLTLDYYIKETADMLVEFPNPSYTGLPDPIRNAATVKNAGFEVITTYREKVGNFKFDLNVNLGFNKNEITALNGGLPLSGAETRVFDGAPALSFSGEGDPIASFYGYVFDGVDGIGNATYKDLSGPEGVPDGVISPEYDRIVIGNPYPDMIYGVRLNTSYKGFELNAFLSGTEGNDVVNASMGYGFAYSNRTRRALDGWSLENPESNVLRPSATEVVNHEFSDYYIEDGSYMRLKNVTIAYNFPQNILDNLKLQKLRVYVSGNNLLTITDYSGFDPEIGVNVDPQDVGIDRGFYPQAQSILGGLQLSF